MLFILQYLHYQCIYRKKIYSLLLGRNVVHTSICTLSVHLQNEIYGLLMGRNVVHTSKFTLSVHLQKENL